MKVNEFIDSGYDLIASEYYTDKHITSKNFDEATNYYFKNKSFDFLEKNNINLCLEIGAGRGSTSRYLNIPSKKIILSDISNLMLGNAPDNSCLLKLQTDGRKTPFLNNTFDLITAFLFDPYNDESLFVEISRILKKGGIFIGTLPHYVWGETLRTELGIPFDKTQFELTTGEILQTNSYLSTASELIHIIQNNFTLLEIEDIFIPKEITNISESILKPASTMNVSPYEIPVVQIIIIKKI
ncbi:MAG: class I SAM-dependent methyltransferase [Paludibacteraceae bacterium]